MKTLLVILLLTPALAAAQITTPPSVPNCCASVPSVGDFSGPLHTPMPQRKANPNVDQDFAPRNSFRVYDPQSSVGATSAPSLPTMQTPPLPGHPEAQRVCLQTGQCVWVWK